jgi:hypothetical protein
MRHEGEWSLTPPRFKEGPVPLGRAVDLVRSFLSSPD